MSTNADDQLDEILRQTAPLTPAEQAEIVLGYLDLVLAAMDAPTLASFRAHYVSCCPAAVTQPTILRIIDRHLAAR